MRRDSRNKADRTFTSARNLLAVLRLATALARLRLSDYVERDDVKEANRLIEQSKILINEADTHKVRNVQVERKNKMFGIIKELAGNNRIVKVSDILERCTSKGFHPDEINSMIEAYEELNVWQVNQAKTRITFV